MYFGADYYPEHWPRAYWENHAQLMQEAHINVVRLAEFAWVKMEPQNGEYDFSWLDDAIDVLSKYQIKVVLGTPTATPPKWLMDKFPDIYTVDAYGIRRGFGSRRHYCYNSTSFQQVTKKIVAKMAIHYKDHPNVVAWQIDNEFGCHNDTQCYCDNCLAAFHKWLQKKYETIDALNQNWGTVFWSQTYGSWKEVILPAYTQCEPLNQRGFAHNPGLLLDYARFASDSVVAYQKLQIDTLKKNGCTLPITHNMMGNFADIDYYDLGKDIDFVSWDNYPATADYRLVSMAHDIMRGIKESNFWVMEQQSGPSGWNVMSDTPKPGQIRLWTYQAIAHGAEAIVYFRWRACPFGTEEYWYGILDHDGIPRRRYFEVQKIGQELEMLSKWFLDSQVVSEVAMVRSYENLWSHRFQPHSVSFDYNNLLLAYYKGLQDNHIATDIVSINSDFAKYKIVLMPAYNLVEEEIKNHVERYVKNGGTIVLTFRSGTRLLNNSMTLKTLPGEFREMAGITVEEFNANSSKTPIQVSGVFGKGTSTIWCDILKIENAKVLARYESDYYAQEPAVTVNSYGKGTVYYVGCDLDTDAMSNLMEYITMQAGIRPLLPQSDVGIEAIQKVKNGKTYLMLLNHNNKNVGVSLHEGQYIEMITGKPIQGTIQLPSFGVAILDYSK